MRNARFNGHLYSGGCPGDVHPHPIACWDTHPCPIACWDTPPLHRQTPIKTLPSRNCCGQLLSYSIKINLFIFHPILAQDFFFHFRAIFSLILFFKGFLANLLQIQLCSFSGNTWWLFCDFAEKGRKNWVRTARKLLLSLGLHTNSVAKSECKNLHKLSFTWFIYF